MEIKEIIAQFRASPKAFPYDAIEDAIRQKDLIIPELFKLIEDPSAILKHCTDQAGYIGHMYALLLLAQFRIPELYSQMFKICETIKNQIDIFGDDFIMEDFPRIIASVYNGDPIPIQKLIENKDVDEYLRETMLKTLFVLCIHGKFPHKSLLEYCTQLVKGKLERKESIVWCGLASISGHIGASHLLPDFKKAYKEGLVDRQCIHYEDIEDDIAEGWDRQKIELANNPHYQMVEDVAAEMEWWCCFDESDADEKLQPLPNPFQPPLLSQQASHRDNNSASPKVGRNQLCPCGSGKKYKKCCGKVISKPK